VTIPSICLIEKLKFDICLRYEAPKEIGPITVNDQIFFSVTDKEGNTIKDQVFTIAIEPTDNQTPIVEITQPAKVNSTCGEVVEQRWTIWIIFLAHSRYKKADISF
jgi:hypothetical protein